MSGADTVLAVTRFDGVSSGTLELVKLVLVSFLLPIAVGALSLLRSDVRRRRERNEIFRRLKILYKRLEFDWDADTVHRERQ